MRSSTFWAILALAGLALPIVTACGGGDQQQQQANDAQMQATTPPTTGNAPPPTGGLPGDQSSAPMQSTSTGLQYQDMKVGTGNFPSPGRPVVVHYTGWLTNGQKFDSSVDKGEPFTFNLGAHEVIQGWDEGVSTMHIGGKRKLVIPPQLGYGDRGAGGAIPPGATLVFDVELLGVQ